MGVADIRSGSGRAISGESSVQDIQRRRPPGLHLRGDLVTRLNISQIPDISFAFSQDYFIVDGVVISSNLLTNSSGNLFLLEFLGIIDPSGFLEETYRFGPSDDDGYFDSDAAEAVLTVGTLSGLFDDEEGAIFGEWMYSHYECAGLFEFTKK